ncbi:MAG: hypothetical protein M3512_00735 [Bacteroidota bacterium]|nr:hypothetical protein [Bacteroidota bacterium]MDQ3534045.1 hypothetical protein [Bacteroidota bacterium]
MEKSTVKSMHIVELTQAQVSRGAIEKLYIEMRHLLNRGHYKPFGNSGKDLKNALLTLKPEIYGSMDDSLKVELDGLVYVIDRLPKGIEECRFIRLISEEGYFTSGFEVIVPAQRRRNCYRIDHEQIFIEVTRGRSEIYDILTHLTFLYIEAEKIINQAVNERGEESKEWLKLKQMVELDEVFTEKDIDGNKHIFTYLSTLLGRPFEETKKAYLRLAANPAKNSGLFKVIYGLGTAALEQAKFRKDREISFTPTLRQRIGHHFYGELWAIGIKATLAEYNLLDRPVHIISANMHSIMNSIFALPALKTSKLQDKTIDGLAVALSKPENDTLRQQVEDYAIKHGMIYIAATSGTNIPVQIIDTSKLSLPDLSSELPYNRNYIEKVKPVILVMDYAFGEQAYETMDELLKPYESGATTVPMNVASISIMGKAGILEGEKGDIMIPTSHVFEGTADNYPIENEFKESDFANSGVGVYAGSMITVLGTSLQNRDVLSYFKNSSWNAIGLEMEGAHYQKAIQSHASIRNNISKDVTIRYAYYASDNPLITGATLASGSLGLIGVKPTYLITINILKRIMNPIKVV